MPIVPTRRAILVVRLSLAILLLLVAARTPAEAQLPPLLTLSTLPGLNEPQQRVGGAIDVICPRLALSPPGSLNSAQTDLLVRCAEMKVITSSGQPVLGTAALPDVLSKVTSEESAVQGNTAIDTRSNLFRAVAGRLVALRLGARGISVSGVPLDLGGKQASASVDQVSGLDERVLTASAEPEALTRLGVFVNGVGGFGDKDTSGNEIGFDFHNAGVTAGADYRFTPNLIGGIAFNYLHTAADFAASAGDVEINSYGFSLYGTYYRGPLYVDLLTGFAWQSQDITRRIVYTGVDRTAKGDTNGFEFTLNAGAGYDFQFGGWTLTPYVRAEYLHLNVDGYTESGAVGLDLKVKDQTVESFLTALGGRVAYAISTPFGVVIPAVRSEWRHEFLDDKRSITAKFVNDPFDQFFKIPTNDPDRDYFTVGATVSMLFAKGVGAFFDYETVLGFRDVTNHNFTAGVRVEF